MSRSTCGVILFRSMVFKGVLYMPQKIRSIANKCLRRILKIWLPETISIAAVLERRNQQRIKHHITSRKWNWIDYTEKKPTPYITRKKCNWMGHTPRTSIRYKTSAVMEPSRLTEKGKVEKHRQKQQKNQDVDGNNWKRNLKTVSGGKVFNGLCSIRE